MFNKNKKTKNIIYSSSFGVAEQFLNYLLAFVYRTVFLYILSQEYLGISGLFTNVLQVFSLAELGIGSVIAFRLYEPIKNQNIYKCSQLIEFYKKIYLIISLIVLLIGLSLFPFLNYLIKDPGEIPSDVNIYIVYGLFVFQSFSSYFFVYYQSLLAADQKGYVISIANSISSFFSYTTRIAFLLITRNYVLVLLIGIIFGVLYNFIFGLYIKNKYREILDLKTEKLASEEKKKIFNDSGSLMFHKVGYTIVNSTDSILLSKFIGIKIVGLYSNYALIATAVDVILNKIFGSFVSTIGNYLITNNEEDVFIAYKRLRFLNFWVASFCAICIYVLIDPFIVIWLDENSLLDKATVIIISANILINSSRIINASFVNAAGLFVKDRARPIIQAVLNLILSIIFIKLMGVSGVFLGTILSTFLTVWWREGFVLYKNIFKKSVIDYFIYNFIWISISVILAVIFSWLCSFFTMDILGFLIKLIICIFGVNAIYFVIFFKTDGHKYFRELLKKKFLRHKRIKEK